MNEPVEYGWRDQETDTLYRIRPVLDEDRHLVFEVIPPDGELRLIGSIDAGHDEVDAIKRGMYDLLKLHKRQRRITARIDEKVNRDGDRAALERYDWNAGAKETITTVIPQLLQLFTDEAES